MRWSVENNQREYRRRLGYSIPAIIKLNTTTVILQLC